ncbi:hypothetical protein ACLB2K_015687 [Fragaria x ananassa]
MLRRAHILLSISKLFDSFFSPHNVKQQNKAKVNQERESQRAEESGVKLEPVNKIHLSSTIKESMIRVGFRKHVTFTRALVSPSCFKMGYSSQSGRLEGKVALITGAASGIGKATASKFISNGAKVVLADIQQQLGQEVAKELGPNASLHCL